MKAKPVIAFVNDVTGLRRSGCQLLWASAARSLQCSGQVDVALVFRSESQPEPDMPEVLGLLANGALHFREVTPMPDLVTRLARRLRRMPPMDPRAGELGWVCRTRPSLAVVCQSGCVGVDYWGPALQAARIPYVTISQCVDTHMWRVDAVNNALRDGYLGARANFFVSAGNRRLMETMLGVPLDNAAVVCNPFRVDYDTPFAWPEEGQMLRMACVGRLFPPAKGQDILLQTLALPNWRERPLQLTLVGQGPCESALRQLVVTLGLQEQVNFAGQVADIAEIWRTHHALVLPSRYEGMPLAVLEALLHGRPCILTAVAGHPEYITDGKNGFLADAPTVPLLAAAMERAWERRDVWEDLGRNAYQRAREQIPCDPGTVLARKLIDLLPEPEQGN